MKLLFSISVYGLFAVMFYVGMDVLRVDRLSDRLSNWVPTRSRSIILEYVVREIGRAHV